MTLNKTFLLYFTKIVQWAKHFGGKDLNGATNTQNASNFELIHSTVTAFVV
jgi:hypothetical protein